MLMAVTPFAPKRPDNVTELFTNIAMVKVSFPLRLCVRSYGYAIDFFFILFLSHI